MDMVKAYLQDSPFTAKQSPENEIAYERLMDVRLKLVDLSFEIDKYHDSYMRFLTQTLNSPDLKNRIGKVKKYFLTYLTNLITQTSALKKGREEPNRPGADDHGAGRRLGARRRQSRGGIKSVPQVSSCQFFINMFCSDTTTMSMGRIVNRSICSPKRQKNR